MAPLAVILPARKHDARRAGPRLPRGRTYVHADPNNSAGRLLAGRSAAPQTGHRAVSRRMTGFLLSVHVLAAILAIGPVAVASSMFPRVARDALDVPTDPRKPELVRLLHRIVRVYAIVGAVVPVFGLATATSLGVLGDAWLIVSIALTSAAALILFTLVLPAQARTLQFLDGADPGAHEPATMVRRLGMHTGIFNLLWAIVVVLMIYRPGSTTGAGI